MAKGKRQTPGRRSGMQVMRRLMGLIRPLIWVMLLAVFLGVTGFLCAIFMNVLGAATFSKIPGLTGSLELKTAGMLIILLAVLRGFLHYGEQLCNHYVAFHILALIRDKLFGALRRLSPAKLETKEKGNLISVMTSDIELLEVFYAHTVSPVIIALITGIVMLVFFAGLHPVMAFIAGGGYLAVGLFMPWVIAKTGREAGAAYRREFGEFNAVFLDDLRGLCEILQYGAKEQRLADIGKRTKSLSEKQKKMKRTGGGSNALTGFLVSLFSLIMLFGGLTLRQSAQIGFREVLLGTVAMASSFGPFIALSGLANNLLHTFAAGNRVLDILDEKPVVDEVTNGKSLAFNGASAENVSFSYAEDPVLKGVSADFRAHQIIGINGQSGCGKSTLLKLFMRFWTADAGRITLSGADINTITTGHLRKTEGFVTQDTQLFLGSIEENIKIGKKDASHEDVVRAAKEASVHEFIVSLPDGYDTQVGELGGRLSGGEKQRIGIARAFLHEAPFLLLDEPTSNLDSLNEGIILQSLIQKRDGKTIILVSHRKSTMGAADKVYTMQGGRVFQEELEAEESAEEALEKKAG